jgi:predicted dehydrogenase
LSAPLRIAIIGCGTHSREHHAASLAWYAEAHPGELVPAAACDLNRERAESFCRDYGFARAYTDLDVMLQAERPDACIAVMPARHVPEMAGKLLTAGIPCSVEKPLGANIEEARRLAALARETGTPHMVSVNRRFNPYLNRALAWVKDRDAGLTFVRATMLRNARKDPGFMWSTAIHAVDTLRCVAGEVDSYEVRRMEGNGLSSAWCSVEFNYASGCRGQLNIFPTAGSHEETYELFGEGFHARASIEGDHPSSVQCWSDGECQLHTVSPDDEPYDIRVGAYDETVEFVTALREGRSPRPTVRDVLKSQEICGSLLHHE